MERINSNYVLSVIAFLALGIGLGYYIALSRAKDADPSAEHIYAELNTIRKTVKQLEKDVYQYRCKCHDEQLQFHNHVHNRGDAPGSSGDVPPTTAAPE